MKNAETQYLKQIVLEDINIQLASLNLIFYEDIIPSFYQDKFFK
jgi:hypothetical protein